MTTTSPLHRPGLHESGYEHASGKAVYVADYPVPAGTLVGSILCSPHAHARILSRNADTARRVPGIHAVFFASDIHGDNHIGPIVHDEPVLAEQEVHFVGQAVALVVGVSEAACREAIAQIEVVYEPLEAILSIREAIASDAFLTPPHTIQRGDVQAALDKAHLRISGEVANGAQDHFYLEPQAAVAIPGEQGEIRILSSTQHPTELQRMAAHVLGVPHHQVICEVPRMGGGFGGKESQSTNFGCLAALACHHTGKPVKICLHRDQDMIMTGKRHPFYSKYEAGFDSEGTLMALSVQIFSEGGWVSDLSTAIMDRALFHLENAYFIPNVHFVGRVCRTHRVSNTAFRGFGGPQGMLVVQHALNRAAEQLGMDPAVLRARNFYREAPRNITPYGQVLSDIRLDRIWSELRQTGDYVARRATIEAFNASSPYIKRGLAFQPLKFGISFTASLLNQAGALLLIYADGSVQLNHGGTEMGQGLHTKMRTVCAHELGVSSDQIRVMRTATDKVPNTSPTAASSGSDLNGQAVVDACTTLKSRMAPIAIDMLQVAPNTPLVFAAGRIQVDGQPNQSVAFSEVASQCWIRRISLSSTGFYATPGIAYDREAGQGTPFFYYAYGACLVEVEVNGLTGEHRMLQADILHDVGNPLVPTIDRGQIEGGFIQGVGWLTCEEVLFHPDGSLITHGPSTYKVPAFGDAPAIFRVHLLDQAEQVGVVGGSKAVGEPPLMLGLAILTALEHAISSFLPDKTAVNLGIPATPEAILRAIHQMPVLTRGQYDG